MPTYVYFDPETDEEIEVSHGMTEEPEIVNPNTGNKMKRRIFSGMVIFKGEGWTAAAKKDINTKSIKRRMKSAVESVKTPIKNIVTNHFNGVLRWLAT